MSRRARWRWSGPSSRQALRDEREKAFAAAILADLDGPHRHECRRRRMRHGAHRCAVATAASPGQPPPALISSCAGASEPNLQQHKADFLSRDGANNATYLASRSLLPRSPFEVKAGTIIPTTLLTGINSDLPARSSARSARTSTTPSPGTYLLIPQGSRLLAAYDSAVASGRSASWSAGTD